MSTGAILMMLVTIAVVWGGLAAALLKLRGHPDEPDPEPGEPGPAGPGTTDRTG